MHPTQNKKLPYSTFSGMEKHLQCIVKGFFLKANKQFLYVRRIALSREINLKGFYRTKSGLSLNRIGGLSEIVDKNSYMHTLWLAVQEFLSVFTKRHV